MTRRASGILLHISSLPGKFGIGDLGPEVTQFISFLKRAKQHAWQILPINPTDPISGHSPYSSSSAFAGNPLFISPENLVRDRLLFTTDLKNSPEFPCDRVDFENVSPFKYQLLKRAYQRFRNNPSARNMHKKDYDKFIRDQAYWVHDFALFVSIKNHFEGEIWTHWPEPLRNREEAALSAFARDHREQIRETCFYQYLFFRQWELLKSHARKNNIQLIGDMSIYMNLDSTDVWAHQKNYKLDGQGQPIAVAGVPPDYFSATGQRWGNPVYNWSELKNDHYSWWIERFKLNFQLFDIVRIDHFRGLVQFWEIPKEEQTAVNGSWADVPTKDFLTTLEKWFSKPLPIMAEDLGYITDDVRAVIRDFDIPNMKVLLFAFSDDMSGNPYLPHNYHPRCTVYTGTHDNNTVLGWFKEEAGQKEIENLQQYLKESVTAENVNQVLVRLAYASDAEMAIIPMQDILRLGSEARMNKPATTQGNWRWRLDPAKLNKDVEQNLAQLTVELKRAEIA